MLEFDLNTNIINKINYKKGENPEGRTDHTFVCYDNKQLILFGVILYIYIKALPK